MGKRQPLLARVYASSERCGECLIWKGAYNKGLPIINYRAPNADKHQCTPVRRAILLDKRAKLLPGYIAMTTCEDTRCVEPSHIIQKVGAEYRKHRLNKVTNHVARGRRISAYKRRISKISDEVVAEIRASSDTLVVLAQRYGISKSYARDIRAGKARRDFSNPFTALLT